ncbi:unnamed protein product [Adineta steineri]|uniref:BLOC-1-related complex subunit 5 n=1 Tax=Adineta steineri TaxID=433720 RepID=A0A814YTF1_9BILA|nr:unnamed protein product [Adineta steineri]CAF1252120.1 unnamed protein product [Adineta steineri]CAF1315591.1 unnamed protein product [Adineta steineri]CAF1326461.1 unnamed protein product [Adineta steineri]CAF1437843.1 unnamed protein product [Adineta steineri]
MGNEQSAGNATSTSVTPKTPVYHPNITVVNSGPIAGSGSGTTASNTSISDDTDLNKLAAIPKFLPILRSSINQQNDPVQIPHLENRSLLQLSMRLQTHFRSCAEVIQTEQIQLISRMKEVDTRSNAVQQRMIDKQKRFTNYCEHSKKLRDVATSLKRLDQSLTTLAERMRVINLCLPSDDQLPSLSFRNQSSTPSS